jgi:predicted RNA-binding Zn-ribbon protein involved in translation (DUF1610 family)
MTTIIDCPTCTRKLNIPEDLLGRPVRCPDCGETFETAGDPSARALPSSAAIPPPPASLPGGPAPAPTPGTPHAVTAAVPGAPAAGTRPCPVCGELIDAAAVRCRFCGEDLAEEDERPWERRRRWGVRRDCEPHRAVLILVFGIVSLVIGLLGLPFGIAAWIMGHQDLKKMSAGAMDPEGRGLTLAGKICGLIGTIFQGFMVVFMVFYFVAIFAILIPMTAPPPKAATPVAVPPPPVAPAPVPAPGERR